MQPDPADTAMPGDADTNESQKSNARKRVQAFRSGGVRLDLLVSHRSARDLDRIAKSLSTSRRHVVEALIRLVATSPDLGSILHSLDSED